MASNKLLREMRKAGGLCSTCGHVRVSSTKWKQCVSCRDKRARKLNENGERMRKLKETDPITELWEGPEWIMKTEVTTSAWGTHKSKIRPLRAKEGRGNYPGLNDLATYNGKRIVWSPTKSSKII